MASMIDKSTDDYLVNLSLCLLEQCCLNEKVPGLICRVILNNLHMQITDKEINLTEEHQ